MVCNQLKYDITMIVQNKKMFNVFFNQIFQLCINLSQNVKKELDCKRCSYIRLQTFVFENGHSIVLFFPKTETTETISETNDNITNLVYFSPLTKVSN